MTRLALALVAGLAAPAHAQGALAPAPLPGAPTCGAFLAIGDYPGRLQALAGIQPLGDEIDAQDEAASRQWADAVAAACEGHPDRPLADAADTALGGD
jgi:hypothetical protein